LLFIVVDENGGVESAIITEPLERTYDRMVLAAAKTWTYQPATRSGAPVKYRKRIQLTLPRQAN
jgi:TonB family protein